MKAPSMSLLRTFSPFWMSQPTILASRSCLVRGAVSQRNEFSSTAQRQKKKNSGGPKKDNRVSLIRYFLNHPLTPRPLRFSRARFLRHWTIHRAWNLFQAKLRAKRQLELMQQYQSMANACEALRHIDRNGLTVDERSQLGMKDPAGEAVGKLYRIAMLKHRIWNNVPIEYARIQTDTPPKNGWNHEWTR